MKFSENLGEIFFDQLSSSLNHAWERLSFIKPSKSFQVKAQLRFIFNELPPFFLWEKLKEEKTWDSLQEQSQLI